MGEKNKNEMPFSTHALKLATDAPAGPQIKHGIGWIFAIFHI